MVAYISTRLDPKQVRVRKTNDTLSALILNAYIKAEKLRATLRPHRRRLKELQRSHRSGIDDMIPAKVAVPVLRGPGEQPRSKTALSKSMMADVAIPQSVFDAQRMREMTPPGGLKWCGKCGHLRNGPNHTRQHSVKHTVNGVTPFTVCFGRRRVELGFG